MLQKKRIFACVAVGQENLVCAATPRKLRGVAIISKGEVLQGGGIIITNLTVHFYSYVSLQVKC